MAKNTELQSVPRSWASDVYVGANSIGANAVQSPMIADGAVGTSELAANAGTGAKLSTVQRNKMTERGLPTVATTGVTEVLLLVPQAGVINGVNFTFKDVLAADNTNFLTFTVVNKGQNGAGTTAILAVDPLNTTKATGGLAIAAYKVRGTVLSAVGGALVVAQYDTLAIQITSAATLANTLTEGHVLVQLDVTL